jgi:hypothetical protein
MNLCQPRSAKSCGACCGLYNFHVHSQEVLTALLRRRTAALGAAPRTPESFRAVAKTLVAEHPEGLFSQVKICPLLGFVDDAETRVGCLAHPEVTGGPDLRDCGAYHQGLCADFFCPSYSWLDEPWAALVEAAAPNWYVYGLIVTDVELLKSCARALTRRMSRGVDATGWAEDSAVVHAFRRLFELRAEGAARSAGQARFGGFEPSSDGDGVPRKIDYARLGLRAAPDDDLVLCLGSDVSTVEALRAARTDAVKHVRAILEAIKTCVGAADREPGREDLPRAP